MIGFKQYLQESYASPMYHATHYANLEKILVSGINADTSQTKFMGMKSASLGLTGVSTARTMRSALDYYYDNQSSYKNYVVLQLNQQQIKTKFKTLPVNYFGTQKLISYKKYDNKTGTSLPNEQEEFIVVPRGHEYKPGFVPSKYIEKIYTLKKPFIDRNFPENNGYDKEINKIKNGPLGQNVKWGEI